MNLRRHALAASLLAVAFRAVAATAPEIEALLGAVADSPCEFHRDGQWLEAEPAQSRMREDYGSWGGKIVTAEDFIARARIDQVRCPGENPQPGATWFKTQLNLIRK